jgi:hypothetical protein
MKTKKRYVGDIYFVDPIHIVEKHRISQYNKLKGSKAGNKRPVMVGIEKSGNKVQISDISTKAKRHELERNLVVELKNTKLNHRSYVDTSTRSKSELTRKHFKVGESPLVKKSKIKVNSQDIDDYNKARNARYK